MEIRTRRVALEEEQTNDPNGQNGHIKVATSKKNLHDDDYADGHQPQPQRLSYPKKKLHHMCEICLKWNAVFRQADPASQSPSTLRFHSLLMPFFCCFPRRTNFSILPQKAHTTTTLYTCFLQLLCYSFDYFFQRFVLSSSDIIFVCFHFGSSFCRRTIHFHLHR